MKRLNRLHFVISAMLGIFLIGCQPNETTQPVSQDLIDAVFASGYVTTEHEYLVTANAEGFLLTALVEEGDQVKKGDQLFVISNNVQTEQLQGISIERQENLHY